MRVSEAQIGGPCHEDWDAMQVGPGGARRFCFACSKSVHDLSEMTEAEARELLAAKADEEICIAYALDEAGRIEHRRVPVGQGLVPVSSLLRARAARASKGATAAMVGALAACTPHGAAETMPELEDEVAEVAERILGHAPPAKASVPPPDPVSVPAQLEEPCEPATQHRRKGKRKILRPKQKTRGVMLRSKDDPLG